jgi:hypothetical protein
MSEARSRRFCAAAAVLAVATMMFSGCTTSTSERWAQTSPVIRASFSNPPQPVTLGMRGDPAPMDATP